MRRVPRPSWAFDPLHCTSPAARLRATPLSNLAAREKFPTTAAAFSTTPARTFLLSGKQDKKKHQQFVRRWQKRLLGDSEPIGAHVDPYDPTSPVRIAPEDQGEYEEVLDDDRQINSLEYTPANNADGLLRVGGEEWLRQKLEGDLAKDYEKLTLRTYTPLTLEMANEIEELTGTPYTLKDENLFMAQMIHTATDRPYTNHNFGLHQKISTPGELRNRFVQAVAEVHSLKSTGLGLDLSAFGNRGVYEAPNWVTDIKLTCASNGELVVIFPNATNADQLVELMQVAPALEPNPISDDGSMPNDIPDLVEPIVPGEQQPTMDIETPPFKRAAVVKVDTESKPFDFMSNRPVPRSTPLVNDNAANMVKGTETTVLGEPQGIPMHNHPVSTAESAESPTREPRQIHTKTTLSPNTGKPRSQQIAKTSQGGSPMPKVEEGRWRAISINEAEFKFAVSVLNKL